MKKYKKRPQEVAASKGAKAKNLHNQFNIQIPEEQEKTEKIMELFRLALGINGLNERKKAKTGSLPTVMFEFHGHTAGIGFQIYKDGWDTEPNDIKGISLDMYVDDGLAIFNENYEKIKKWLMGFKEAV